MRVREAVARLDDLDGRVDAATAATAADADAAAGCPWLGLLRDRLRLQNQGPTRSTERRERLRALGGKRLAHPLLGSLAATATK